jgi:hypothetical protein
MSNLQELVEIVRASRERTNGVFPLPDVDSCIDYAITEAGEYLDAVLREQRNGDKRNNDKQHNPRKEWGQCGYMIASAIMQMPEFDDYDSGDWIPLERPELNSVYTLLILLCEIKEVFTNRAEVDALDIWHAFTVQCGWNPADLLTETCADFERKHLRAPFVYPVLSAEQAAAQGEVVGSV